jgi:hypothetical protein
LLTHVNAYEVFPREIVEEIQKHCSGGYLWIPKPEEDEILSTLFCKFGKRLYPQGF